MTYIIGLVVAIVPWLIDILILCAPVVLALIVLGCLKAAQHAGKWRV